MSFILDALRKSETARRRSETPDLFATMPGTTATAPARAQWPLLAIGGVGVLSLIAALWLFSQRMPASVSATTATDATAKALPKPPDRHRPRLQTQPGNLQQKARRKYRRWVLRKSRRLSRQQRLPSRRRIRRRQPRKPHPRRHPRPTSKAQRAACPRRRSRAYRHHRHPHRSPPANGSFRWPISIRRRAGNCRR